MSRPRKHPLPPISELRRLFTYDPETGIIRHTCRDDNKRFAGKVAGTIHNLGYSFYRINEYGMHLGHRVAWAMHYGEWPVGEIDHRNGNKLDNRIANLRMATRTQNMGNLLSPVGRSGYRGVTKARQRWQATITVDGKRQYLGTFDTGEQAAEAYGEACRKHRGEFALVAMGTMAATILFTMEARA